MGHLANLASYIICSIVFIAILAYAFLYSARLKGKKATEDKYGRPPIVREEGIAIATDEKEKQGRPGTLS
jgi:hypothetical protein